MSKLQEKKRKARNQFKMKLELAEDTIDKMVELIDKFVLGGDRDWRREFRFDVAMTDRIMKHRAFKKKRVRK